MRQVGGLTDGHGLLIVQRSHMVIGKINLKIGGFLRQHHFSLLIGVVVAIILAEALFLYKFFYVPLTETKVIGQLRQQTALEPLDLELFEQLRTAAAKKRAPPAVDWNALRDPFSAPTKTAAQ